jgi:ABC-type transporter Mla subunit MlaD
VTDTPETVPAARLPQPKRTLFSISEDLDKLNELLDEAADDAEQHQLINEWLEQLGEERDRKIDNYAALISEVTARAAVRRAEAQRLLELAQADENRAKLLKERLKSFFEVHKLKTIETTRYKLSLQRHGGKAPLILNEDMPPDHLPEQFRRTIVEPDTKAIREALEAGEKLDFASLGERGQSIRIK